MNDQKFDTALDLRKKVFNARVTAARRSAGGRAGALLAAAVGAAFLITLWISFIKPHALRGGRQREELSERGRARREKERRDTSP